MVKSDKLIAAGEWDGGFAWELHASDTFPPRRLCTAIACVAIDNLEENTIALTHNQRGWELLGGHFDADSETFQEAIRRESLEEGGFVGGPIVPFAYRKITASGPPATTGRAAAYPHPVSYMSYVYALRSGEYQPVTGEEIIESGVYTPAEIARLVERGHTKPMELTIIRLGLAAARADHNLPPLAD